jgi:hypothetical protein
LGIHEYGTLIPSAHGVPGKNDKKPGNEQQCPVGSAALLAAARASPTPPRDGLRVAPVVEAAVAILIDVVPADFFFRNARRGVTLRTETIGRADHLSG